jgi:hypothetical protein
MKGIIIAGWVAFLIGLGIGVKLCWLDDQLIAIEHNAAHYDPKTGKFTWNQ